MDIVVQIKELGGFSGGVSWRKELREVSAHQHPANLCTG